MWLFLSYLYFVHRFETEFVVVQPLSHVWLSVTPWTAAHQASLSFNISRRWWSTESVTSSNHLVLCHPLLLQLSIFPSIRVFANDPAFVSGGQSIGALASSSVLPMNIQDWFPLGQTGLISLQSKGLLSLFQHHSSKALILQHPVFFMVQVSYPYMTTVKTIALTVWIFVERLNSKLKSWRPFAWDHIQTDMMLKDTLVKNPWLTSFPYIFQSYKNELASLLKNYLWIQHCMVKWKNLDKCFNFRIAFYNCSDKYSYKKIYHENTDKKEKGLSICLSS